MNSFRLFLCSFLLLVTHATAQQEPPEDPRAGELVDCGKEKAVIIEQTTSKDGRYALGWTLRPAGKHAPVDWSIYDKNDVNPMIDKFSSAFGGEGKEDYTLVNGLLDLQAKAFTLLPTEIPYYSHKNHGQFSVLWSEERPGTRYVVAANDARFNTANLWLIELGAGGPRVTDLKPAADKAVSDLMRKRDPKDHDKYVVTYGLMDYSSEKGKMVGEFKEGSLKVRFSADIPKSETEGDAGSVMFALPKGNITNVTADRKK